MYFVRLRELRLFPGQLSRVGLGTRLTHARLLPGFEDSKDPDLCR